MAINSLDWQEYILAETIPEKAIDVLIGLNWQPEDVSQILEIKLLRVVEL